MSIQAVSNVSIFQALQNNHDRRTDLRQLTSALSAGNLNQAQQGDVSAIQLPYQTHNFWQQRRAGLEQLGQALRVGNADAAQQAYDALVALGQNGPLRNGETFHRADRAQDFAAIGQALASGDLAGARTAFVDLASSFGQGIPSVRGFPPGPPTPIPQVGLPPGPPTLIPPQDTLPPGPPTLIHPPTSVGGGPSGPPEIAGNQSVLNLLKLASNSAAKNGSLSLRA